jgi:hypothetical protein
MFRVSSRIVLLFLSLTSFLSAQTAMDHQHHPPEKQPAPSTNEAMPDMPQMNQSTMQMGSENFIDAIQLHTTSGTSAEPNSTEAPMLMTTKGKWTLMFHGTAWINMIQQSGARGQDKVFSTNWFMPMAQRKLGEKGTLTLRTMLSLEPATVTGRFYPELFQVGETAFGKGIVDGQHPHDLFMEIAALYDHKIAARTLLSFYAAPVGDPAMGPTAYPHRASASENPIAPLGHHFEDSTHIASDVVTVGLTHRAIRLEASGFHGREPDENRWNIDQGKLDSWSTRLTVNPAQNWSWQYSFARLTSPEALHPGEDIDRMTSSLMYNRPTHDGNFAGTLLWGRNKISDGLALNGYLAEGTWRFRQFNAVWGRIELADRTSELLSGNNALTNTPENFIGRVKAFTTGYDHDFDFIPHIATAFGGQLTVYGAPDSVKAIYGSHPVGVVLFVHFRLKGNAAHKM